MSLGSRVFLCADRLARARVLYEACGVDPQAVYRRCPSPPPRLMGCVVRFVATRASRGLGVDWRGLGVVWRARVGGWVGFEGVRFVRFVCLSRVCPGSPRCLFTGRAGALVGWDGCEGRLSVCPVFVPCPCVSRLPPVSFYRYCNN